jgi:hypothetical protein
MTITSVAGSAGCGCGNGPVTGGNGHGAPASGCACGGSGTPCTGSCRKQGTARPRFFAGQLLTEDDLEALTAYVTAKSRLHTRYLAGAGVVCGLEVTCPPCGGGTIRVQPGYALDCCGRDIMLPCPVDLDINAMVRDLRLSQIGADCGDPCPPASMTAAGTSTRGQDKEPVRHYCLYVRYDEQLADPVAPYITEEPCGQPACEPTRVYEGYQFLLRCQSDRPPPVTITDRFLACLPPSDVTRLADNLAKYAGPLREAGERAEQFPFDGQALVKATSALTKTRESIKAPTPEEARALDGMIRDVAAELARLQLQDEATQQQTTKDNQTAIAAAQAELAAAATVLASAPDDSWPEPLDGHVGHALVQQALQLADPKAPHLDPVEARMLAQRAPFDRDVWSALADGATDLRDWLLGRLDEDPLLTDCELRAAAERLRIPDTDTDDPISRAAATATSRLASDLSELVGRYERNCICAAINPPCPPCNDDAVLLACLDVRDCAVVRICSTVRDWVVSGPALCYWIPQLAGLHQLLEAFCCGEDSPSERSQRLDQLAATGQLPPPLAAAFGGPAAPSVTEQIGSLWDEIRKLTGQVASTRRALSTEKARITNLSRASQGKV